MDLSLTCGTPHLNGDFQGEPKPRGTDDDFWDAFPIDDEPDPLPEDGDFWVEQNQQP